MRYLPTLHRVRRRPVPPACETMFIPGGAVGLDIGAVLHQLAMRALLQDTGTRSRL